MTSGAHQLEIRRIYSASPARAAASAARGAEPRFSLLGVFSLLVAGAWVYLAWWPVDRLVSRNLLLTVMQAPGAGTTWDLDHLLGRAPDDLAHPAPPEGTEAVAPLEESTGLVGPDPEHADGQLQATMRSLYTTMWVWFVVTTAAAFWLAMCGGAATAALPTTDPAKRRPLLLTTVILALVAAGLAKALWLGAPVLGLHSPYPEIAFVVCLLVAVYILGVTLSPRAASWTAGVSGLALVGLGGMLARDWYTGSYAIFNSYPPAAPRIAATLLMVVAVLAGAATFRRLIGLHRVAVALIVGAAVTTVVALGYADHLGGIHTHTLSTATYASITAAQVAGAVLLVGAVRLRVR